MNMVKNCKSGSVSLIDPTTLLVQIDADCEIGVEQFYEFTNVAAKISANKKMYSIVSYGSMSLPTREVREHCRNNAPNLNILANAIVVSDLAQLIMARHSVKRRKSKTPIKIFTELSEAEKWVENLKSNKVDNQLIEL